MPRLKVSTPIKKMHEKLEDSREWHNETFLLVDGQRCSTRQSHKTSETACKELLQAVVGVDVSVTAMLRLREG